MIHGIQTGAIATLQRVVTEVQSIRDNPLADTAQVAGATGALTAYTRWRKE